MENNKKAGTEFEKELAGILASDGFWVHRLQDNVNGQPFDIIAARDEDVLAIDCKHCARCCFPLNRIEENQHLAMRAWENAGNIPGLFAVKFPSEAIYLIEYRALARKIGEGAKQINETDAGLIGQTLRKGRDGADNKQ